ncbi:cytochrome P450 [Mycena filopes]|nr:cytochrome P450 [Mycena filopes]
MPTTLLSVLLLLLFLVTALHERGRRKQLELPSLGFNGVWSSYFNSVVDTFHANAAIQARCRKVCDQLLLNSFLSVAAEEVHSSSPESAAHCILNFTFLSHSCYNSSILVGRQFCDETYHISAIKTSLNQNLANILPNLVDEIVCGYKDVLDPQLRSAKEWNPVRALDTFTHIICRSSNRVFVGLPLSRDEDYCQLASRFSASVLICGPMVKFLLPRFLRPLAGRIFQTIFRHHDRMLKHLKPVIAERRKRGTKIDNDMLTWLMDSAPEQSPESLAMRMLNVNFVAIHTTSKTFTHALYHLASKPSYIQILPTRTTWTKEALGRCIRLDSFLKECQRLNGMGALWMPRWQLTIFTFSDGTKISPGTFVATAATAIHEDAEIYERPLDFDGLRFSAAARAAERPKRSRYL